MPPSPRPPHSLHPPKLYAIVDADLCGAAGRAPADVARAFLTAGARWLQLRCKNLGSAAFLELTNIVVEDAQAAGAIVFVNDRADVAKAAGAPGLHVGQDDLTPTDARVVVGPSVLIGLSTHTRAQWESAVGEPISYLAVGPAFSTGTKNTGYEAIGLGVVREAAAFASVNALPTVAIGGITLENAIAVLDAGASSVAVISDLLRGNPEARCRQFLRALG